MSVASVPSPHVIFVALTGRRENYADRQPHLMLTFQIVAEYVIRIKYDLINMN